MKVLIIDDSSFMRGIIRVALESGGYKALELVPSSLLEVLDVLRREKPDLVLTDLEMPTCHGETLVRAIREDADLKATPILMLTAHGSRELEDRLKPWNLLGFLAKPIDAQGILEGVQAVLPLPKETP
jgi:DNA-binding response OmpR family regulator